jgi:hypothetical protein
MSMSAFSERFRSRNVVLIFLALVAYGVFSFIVQSSEITPQLPSLIVRDENVVLLLPPLRVFREWQNHHSVEAIKRNPHNRTFIIGGYSCPRQAGNLIHEFLTALLQAVATNRTFLWEHRRNTYWRNIGENSEEACDRILQRASWIPSYSERSRTLQLDRPIKMQHNHSHTYPEMRQHLDRGERATDDLSDYQVILPVKNLQGLSMERTEVWQGLLLLTDYYEAKYLSQMYGMDLIHDDRVQALYSQRVSFLYGMLFRESFDFTEQFLETVSEDWYQQSGNSTVVSRSRAWRTPHTHTDPPSVYTIGLHSRHTKSSNNGSNVQNEIKCLEYLLTYRENDKVPCTVYIMSDRPKTIENLRTYMLERSCSVVVVAHIMDPVVNDTGTKTEEQGPFAGAGFFRDLLVVSQARSAFIGDVRSSSALVDELMDYGRRTEAWHSKNAVDPLLRCSNGNWHRFERCTRRSWSLSRLCCRFAITVGLYR